MFIKDDRIERMKLLSSPKPHRAAWVRCEGCPWRPTPRNSPPAHEHGAQGAGAVVPLPLRATLLKLLRLPFIRSLRVENSRNPGRRPALC